MEIKRDHLKGEVKAEPAADLVEFTEVETVLKIYILPNASCQKMFL